MISSISEVSSKDWDECAMDSCSPAKMNPFIMHGFLSSLEESNCSAKVCSTEFSYFDIFLQAKLKIVIFNVDLLSLRKQDGLRRT